MPLTDNPEGLSPSYRQRRSDSVSDAAISFCDCNIEKGIPTSRLTPFLGMTARCVAAQTLGMTERGAVVAETLGNDKTEVI